MAQEIDLLKFVGLTQSGKDTLEGQKLFVADARERFAYKDGRKTDSVVGTTVVCQVERDRSNELSSKTFEIKTDQVFEPEKIIDASISVEINGVKIWASTRKGSDFARPEVSLVGTIQVEEDDA